MVRLERLVHLLPFTDKRLPHDKILDRRLAEVDKVLAANNDLVDGLFYPFGKRLFRAAFAFAKIPTEATYQFTNNPGQPRRTPEGQLKRIKGWICDNCKFDPEDPLVIEYLNTIVRHGEECAEVYDKNPLGIREYFVRLSQVYSAGHS